MKIMPYVYIDGVPTFRDSDVAKLFDKMGSNGANLVFYDGTIINRDQFVSFIKSPGLVLFVAMEDNNNPIACGWITNVSQRTAEGHFCVFKEAWGDKGVEAAKLMIKRAMEMADLDGLINKTPKFNKLAIKFIQKCGAVILGEVPFGSVNANGQTYPTVYSYIAR